MDTIIWQPLPEGYELVRITKADGTHPKPLCDHLIDTPRGPSLHCGTFAVFGLPAEEGWRDYRSYSCIRHKSDDLSKFAGATEED